MNPKLLAFAPVLLLLKLHWTVRAGVVSVGLPGWVIAVTAIGLAAVALSAAIVVSLHRFRSCPHYRTA